MAIFNSYVKLPEGNPLISPKNSMEPLHWTNQSQVEPFHGSTHCDEPGAELLGDQMVKAIRYENCYTIWYYDISHTIYILSHGYMV